MIKFPNSLIDDLNHQPKASCQVQVKNQEENHFGQFEDNFEIVGCLQVVDNFC